jgi:hypothetical protein
VVIHHEDVHQFEIQFLQHRLKGEVRFEYVHVHVDRMQSRQRFQGLLVRGGLRCGSGYEPVNEQNACGGD